MHFSLGRMLESKPLMIAGATLAIAYAFLYTNVIDFGVNATVFMDSE